jgi:hypothetical protein
MDEIAKEYDVIVIGTGMFRHCVPTRGKLLRAASCRARQDWMTGLLTSFFSCQA